MATQSRHRIRNASTLICDFAFFSIGFTFFDPTVMLPSFISELVDSELLIGVLTAVRLLMLTTPQLVAASVLRASPVKKPLLLYSSIGGRLPVLILAILTLALAMRSPWWVAISLLLVVGLFYTSEGLNSISWPDLVGKVIPESIRGRFLGGGQLISSLGSLGAGYVVQRILVSDRLDFAGRWTSLFAISFVFLMLSVVAIALVKEEPEPREQQPLAIKEDIANLFRYLRADRNLMMVAVAQILLGVGSTVFPFFVVRAKELIPSGEGMLGTFLILQNLGGAVAAVLCGYLIDHLGSWSAIRVNAVAQALAIVAAIAAPSLGTAQPFYLAAFFLIGIINGSSWWSFTAYLMELATEEQRPTYLAAAGVLRSPVSLLSIVAGGMFELFSSETVFVGALLISIAGGYAVWRLARIHKDVARPAGVA